MCRQTLYTFNFGNVLDCTVIQIKICVEIFCRPLSSGEGMDIACFVLVLVVKWDLGLSELDMNTSSTGLDGINTVSNLVTSLITSYHVVCVSRQVTWQLPDLLECLYSGNKAGIFTARHNL